MDPLWLDAIWNIYLSAAYFVVGLLVMLSHVIYLTSAKLSHFVEITFRHDSIANLNEENSIAKSFTTYHIKHFSDSNF